MAAFLLALIAAAATTLAGREAVRVARLSASLGAGPGLAAAVWLAALFAAAVAARLGGAATAEFAPEARATAVAAALGLAALAALLLRPGPAPAEPTRSLGAIALVLGSGQLVGTAGLAMFAVAAATGEQVAVAAGGALGGGAVLTAAWAAGAAWEQRLPRALVRASTAGLLAAAAAYVALAPAG